MKQIRVLITGAGSVMGQSIYRSMQHAKNAEHMFAIITNSHDLGAAFYFNQKNYHPVIEKTCIVPLAADPTYETYLHQLVIDNNIDIIFSGTQHEILRIANYSLTNPIAAVLKPSVLNIALDKWETAHFFNRYQIRTPKTWLLHDLRNNIDASYFPLVLKPRSSSSSRNIFVIKNLAEWDDFTINHPKIDDTQIIVQEYIEGEEYTCGCYIDRYSKAVNTIILNRTLTADGATGYAEVIKDEAIDAYLFTICQAMQAEGMEFGHINVQFRLKDGLPYCFEINGRLSSTEAPKAVLGFNSVDAYIHNIALEQPYEEFNVQHGKRFLRYYEEVFF